jgi:hypothetical protein
MVSIVFIFFVSASEPPCVKGLLDRDWTVTRQRHECVRTRNYPEEVKNLHVKKKCSKGWGPL